MAKINSEMIHSEEDLARLLEQIAANAWPPRERADLGNWRLRANDGVTRRANSVLAAGAFPEGDWLEAIEGFYRNRGISPCFQVSNSSPSELDGILEHRGYSAFMQCFMMVASCEEILKRTEQITSWSAKFALEVDDGWLDDFLVLEDFPNERKESYRSIFKGIMVPKCFVSVLENGERIGLASAVLERGWAGISNVIVDPRHRRKGVAGSIFRALCEWSLAQGAQHIYLQVLRKNAGALDLYNKLGFSVVSEYHYRIHND